MQIEQLIYPETIATADIVEWGSEELKRLAVELLPLHILGTLHSHINYEPHVSKIDITSATEELVFGIYSIWAKSSGKAKTDLTFYTGIKIVDFEVL